jgi:hypothetical protein
MTGFAVILLRTTVVGNKYVKGEDIKKYGDYGSSRTVLTSVLIPKIRPGHSVSNELSVMDHTFLMRSPLPELLFLSKSGLGVSKHMFFIPELHRDNVRGKIVSF